MAEIFRHRVWSRMHAAALSLQELGDLLGIHPHHLHAYDSSGGLFDQPVRALITLAARLDLHPADLIPATEPVLANHGNHRRPCVPPCDLDTDALAVLTAPRPPAACRRPGP